MTDQETINRFIFLRSQGWSFNRIQTELNVSKPTLMKWSRQHRVEIANLRATETEALVEAVFGPRHERWRRLATQLKALEEEIARRDLEEIPASRLHAIAAQLRAEIRAEQQALTPLELAASEPLGAHNHEPLSITTTWNA
jgi:orotate phosphoribosyltransferase-like protein